MFDIRSRFMQHSLLDLKSYQEGLEDGRFGFNVDTDAKRAVNLAISLYHMTDHMPTKEFDRWYRECQSLLLVQNIANIYKHNGLDLNRPQYRRRPPLVTTSDAVWQTLVITMYEDKQGPYSIAYKEVMVTLDDGSEKELTPVLFGVFNFWIDELDKLGSRTVPHVPIPDRSKIQGRDSKGKEGDIEIFMVNGEEIRRKVLVRKYDYSLGQPVPYDFEGEGVSKVEAKVYKTPPTVVNWTLTDKQGRKHKLEVPLTEEQVERYNNTDPRLQANYLMLLAQESEAYQNLVRKLQQEDK